MNNAQLYVLATRLEQIERALQFSGQIPTRRSLRHQLQRVATFCLHWRRCLTTMTEKGQMPTPGEDAFSQQRPPDEHGLDVHRCRE